MQGIQVLEQPYTTAAMDGGNKQVDSRNTSVGEVKQFITDVIVVEVGIAGTGTTFGIKTNAGCRHHLVVPVQFFLGENLVNHAATVAAKWFLIINYRILTTFLPTMNTVSHKSVLLGAKITFIFYSFNEWPVSKLNKGIYIRNTLVHLTKIRKKTQQPFNGGSILTNICTDSFVFERK